MQVELLEMSSNEDVSESVPIFGNNSSTDSHYSLKSRSKNGCLSTDCVKKAVASKLPCLGWIPKYNLKFLQCDFIAGLTVGLTVIPQALAYAQIAGLPIQYGLYSAFMGSFIYSMFGTSKDVTLGPTAIMSLLVKTYGDSDPIQAVCLTLLGGCIQAGMGILRLGFIMRYIAAPVVSGFTSAAALTIGLGQLKHIFGVKTTSSDFFPELIEAFKGLSDPNEWDMVLGILCICLLLLLKYMGKVVSKWKNDEETTTLQRRCRKFLWIVSLSRNAITVISAAAVAYAIKWSDDKNCKHPPDCLTLTGNLTQGLPPFKAPVFVETINNKTLDGGDIIKNIGDGLLIVPLMGILESLAIGKAFARTNGYDIDVNQEMLAIGLSNIASSFVSAFSITGSFSRTAINSQSGVKTPAGGIVTGIIVIFGLAVLTPLIFYIPKSALASVIISAVIFMVDLKTVKTLWNTKRIDLLPLLVTFGVCFYQIPYGILAGVGTSLLLLLYPITFPKLIYEFQELSSTDANEEQSSHQERGLVVKIQGGLVYPAGDFIQSNIKKHLEEQQIKMLVLHFTDATAWDYSGLLMLDELYQMLKKDHVKLSIVDSSHSMRMAVLNQGSLQNVTFYNSLKDLLEEGC